MKPQLRIIFILFLAQLPFTSCQEDDSDSDLHPNKITLTAKAGPDQYLLLPQNSAFLDGSQSTVTNGKITTYNWSQISGPTSSQIMNAAAAQTQVSDLMEGGYQFELKVTAEGGVSSRDTVLVVVEDAVVDTVEYVHWAPLRSLPAEEFFFYSGSRFIGSSFLMGISNQVFAVSNKGGVWRLSESSIWKYIGSFPEQMERAPVVFSIHDKGYCMGESHLWQYDAGQNKWQQKSDLPIRGAQVALVIQDKAYLVGANQQVRSYEPSTDTYATKADFPGTEAVTGFVVNGKGFWIGVDGTCWEYDPVKDSWQQKASLPPSIMSMKGFSLNNYGYVIGDLNHAAYNHNQPIKVWRYEPTVNEWHEFEEDYPGSGVYEINTVSMQGRAVIGLGYNNGDWNAIDIWEFD